MHEQFTLFDPPKRCTKCGEIKPFSEFAKAKDKKDGRASHCKPCVRAYYKQYRANNRERINQKNKDKRAANPEKHRKWVRDHYWRNVETERERSRAKNERDGEIQRERVRDWQQRNPAKCRQRWQTWYEKNREHYYAVKTLWRHDNREKIALYDFQRRARDKGAPGKGASLAELTEVHGPLCHLCNCRVAVERDHVIPLTRGGTNHLDNLRPVCRSCNAWKGNKLMNELRWSDGA